MGATSIDGTSLYANNGATLSLPNVTGYTEYNNNSPTFQAYDAGSEIDLPGLTGLSGMDNWLYIDARQGGEVDLSQVASITNSYVNISADGTGTGDVASTIDLSAWTTFSETGGPYGDLSATNGGDVIAPLLTAPIEVNITVGDYGAATPSQMNTSQLTSLLGGSISRLPDRGPQRADRYRRHEPVCEQRRNALAAQRDELHLIQQQLADFSGLRRGERDRLAGLTSLSGMTTGCISTPAAAEK